jgi:26S proteasome regulatory subunit N9
MSSYVDRTAAAIEHCEALAVRHPAMAESYTQMASYLHDKLWHQLTLVVLQVLSVTDESTNTTAVTAVAAAAAVELYDKVVLVVDGKLHPLALARMAVLVAQHLKGSGDAAAAKAILENCLERLSQKNVTPEATIYLQSKHALLILSELADTTTGADLAAQARAVALPPILAVIQANAPIIQELSSAVDNASSTTSSDASEHNMVHAAHYEAVMTYYKLVGPTAAFYEHAMQYLQYAGPATTTASAAAVASNGIGSVAFAVDLVLAALTGVGIYNLTAVTEQTAVLAPIQDPTSSYFWLWEILQAVAAGDVPTCRALSTKHAAAIAREPALATHAAVVQEKLTLTALVTAVGQLHAHERCLSLETVQRMIHLEDFSQVELVLMRAFCVGLLRGQIDQVAGTVDITYVQPRRLTTAQMKDLATKFGEWAVKVHQTSAAVQEQTSATLLA